MPERDVVANNAMISALSKYHLVEQAPCLFDSLLHRNSATWNSMISCYCNSGDVKSARLVFGQNPIKDVVSWNAMIDGAIFTFRAMQAESVKTMEVTMIGLLSAYAHLGALEMGKWVHAFIKRKSLKIDVVVDNALIDMYCKCGSIDIALDVFHGFPEKNIFCWNSMMVGCSHSGLVPADRKYFSQMVRNNRVEPGIEHYGCMTDLLGRAGLLKEALELVRSMPMKPNSVLDPADGENYVFLSNLYATMSHWTDVEKCRKLMTERGVLKTPGCSSIEVDFVVHEFVVKDISHPQYPWMAAFLDEMERNSKGMGMRRTHP
ncbi:E motif [Dillenia turbinata]|uniref:E motif n=1 Tax=Dillenia turbinata TaxID=194707 RepID=A0AAN8Z6Z5_9MAGN